MNERRGQESLLSSEAVLHRAAARLAHDFAGMVGEETVAGLLPHVATVLGEIGVDTGEEFPKPLTDDVVRAADAVVTMGCGDACPIYPGKRYLDWQLADPAGLDLDGVRRVRDEIQERVRGLLSELVAERSAAGS